MTETIPSSSTAEQVKMADGRTVAFAGKRKMIKSVDVDSMTINFDFRNGESRSFQIPHSLLNHAACHGASQKIGDETAGVEEVDDMVVAVDDMIARLNKGEWKAAREAGDGFAGASVVIRAICEVTGKGVDEIKAFLQGKLDAAKERGEKLTRAELYASFRNPASKTGVVIERLEAEKKAKKAHAVNSDDLLNEIS